MAHNTLHLELAPNVRGSVAVQAGTRDQWVAELMRLNYDLCPDGVWRHRRDLPPQHLGGMEEVQRLLHSVGFLVSPLSEQWVRPDMRDAIDGWVNGTHPFLGGFLTALLEGRLEDALGRADHYNQHTFPALMSYVYHHVPASAKGLNFQAHKERVMALAKERSKG